MSSDPNSWKQRRPEHVAPNRSYRNRYGAAQLADQQVEAAMREMRERFDRVEANPRDRNVANDAVGYAWRILTYLGYPDFDAIRSLHTEDWPTAFEPNLHGLVSLALETIGWHHFGLRRYDIDRTARIFDRVAELTPHNQRALERFAIVANEIQPEHIGGLAKFPKKQKETALGYKLQCKRKVDEILQDVFSIGEGHLMGQSEPSVAAMLPSLKERDRRFVFNILGHLSRMNSVIGDFFENGTMLSLGMGAACCQLEILGFPRDVHNVIPICLSRLDEDSSGQVAGEETQILCEILKVIATISASKARMFNNQGAARRVKEVLDLVAKIEQRLAEG